LDAMEEQASGAGDGAMEEQTCGAGDGSSSAKKRRRPLTLKSPWMVMWATTLLSFLPSISLMKVFKGCSKMVNYGTFFFF
ncbi:hypothetical protein EJB05_12961, partial [Eragrostis curvula]